MSKIKKVMKIKNIKDNRVEFLFAFNDNSVATCKAIKDAIDVSDFTFDQISFLFSNLTRKGYRVEVVETKVKE